ncbi:MAG: hypothetical protein ABI193_22160 [Minicystis sp.]
MAFTLVTLSCLSGWLAACGSSGETAASTGATSGAGGTSTVGATVTGTGGAGESSSTAGGGTTSTTGSSTSASTGTGELPHVRFCAKGCQKPADCKLDSGAYDTDNFACTDGACEFLGCKTNAECVTSNNNNPNFVCGTDLFLSVRYCATKCQTAVDCQLDSGAFDKDHFACMGGGCAYLGCKTDAECAASNNNNPNFVCGTDPAYPIHYCSKKCQAPVDCKADSGAYDTDNSDCVGGACTYLGCKTNAECVISNSAGYVCGG